MICNYGIYYKFLHIIGRLLRPNSVSYRLTSLGTKIFLRELTLSNTLSLNANCFTETAVLSSPIL